MTAILNHPNSIIVAICASVGINLKKGDAAKIHAKAGSLDRQAILKAAGATPTQLAIDEKATNDFLVKDSARLQLNHLIDPYFPEQNPKSRSLRMIAYDRFLPRAIEHLSAGQPVDDLLPDLDAYLCVIIEDKAFAAAKPTLLQKGLADGLLLLEREPTLSSVKAANYEYDAWFANRRSAEDEIIAAALAKRFLDSDQVYKALTTPIVDEDSLRLFQTTCEFFGRLKTTASNTLKIVAIAENVIGRLNFPKPLPEPVPALLRQRQKERAVIHEQRLAKADTFVPAADAQAALGCTEKEFSRWIHCKRIPVARRKSHTVNRVVFLDTMHDPETFPAILHNIPEWRRLDALNPQPDQKSIPPQPSNATLLKEAALIAGYPNIAVKNEHSGIKIQISFGSKIIIPFGPHKAVPNCFNFLVQTSIPRKNLRVVLADVKPLLDFAVSTTIAAMKEAASECAIHAETLTSGLPDDRIPAFLELFAAKTTIGPAAFDNNVKKIKKTTGDWLTGALESAAREIIALDAAATIHARCGLANYPALFPQTRAMTRELVLHVGPTNSGKTHAALDALAHAATGLYAAPLRLMALEAFERMNTERGIPCDLRTGEERIEVAGAGHVACTIEMSNFNRPIDIAVIDEIQMLADEERGWAWAAAVIGLPAQTLILTGSADAIPYIQSIIAMTGDKLTIKTFQRKTSLTVIEEPLEFKDLRPGDALIAFSRSETLRLREELTLRNKKVAVIYGALGPEVRRAEAARFRSGEAEILIATDCIGLGLNLPCRRVLFTSLHKYDGEATRLLTHSEIRQIAGRAGRYGMHEAGQTGMFGAPYEPVIATALASPPIKPKDARLFAMPTYAAILEASRLLETQDLTRILNYFCRTILNDDPTCGRRK